MDELIDLEESVVNRIFTFHNLKAWPYSSVMVGAILAKCQQFEWLNAWSSFTYERKLFLKVERHGDGCRRGLREIVSYAVSRSIEPLRVMPKLRAGEVPAVVVLSAGLAE